MKFGGASVASIDQFCKIAKIVINRKKEYKQIAVVVSAMGNTTNDLFALAKKVNEEAPRRELDMLATAGERISIALLAMALAKQKIEVVSFTGSQSGIITSSLHNDAKIIEVRPYRLKKVLYDGKIAIVAGFQGVSREGEITTLGRGGSDTSAVALGIALNAEKIEFYKDVEGVYAEDPKVNFNAELFSQLTYEEALEIIQKGAKILHARAILLAQKNGLPLHILSFLPGRKSGTWIKENSARKELQFYEE